VAHPTRRVLNCCAERFRWREPDSDGPFHVKHLFAMPQGGLVRGTVAGQCQRWTSDQMFLKQLGQRCGPWRPDVSRETSRGWRSISADTGGLCLRRTPPQHSSRRIDIPLSLEDSKTLRRATTGETSMMLSATGTGLAWHSSGTARQPMRTHSVSRETSPSIPASGASKQNTRAESYRRRLSQLCVSSRPSAPE
jgi:hypothetical protein